ncbi:hypothetical protein FRB97_009585 [Tulasnella sp. 331]|nr:hypothetical protein FRB97_009585 [Tulasnella sp. 331]KAG8873256.1 hypothetical protein FRB98_009134 [Tulasnella sp. 332]
MSRRPLSSSSTHNAQHVVGLPTYTIKRRPPPLPTQEDLLPPPFKPKVNAPSASRITYIPHPNDSNDEENRPPAPTAPAIPFSSRPRTTSFFSLAAPNNSSPLRDATNRQSLIARAISRRKALVNEVEEAFSTSSDELYPSLSPSSLSSHAETSRSWDIHGISHHQDYRSFHAWASQDPHVTIAPSTSSPCSSSRIGLGFLSSYDDQPFPSTSPSHPTSHQTHDDSSPSSSSPGTFCAVPALIRTLASSWPSSPPLDGGWDSVLTNPRSYFSYMTKHTQEAQRLQAEREVQQHRFAIAGILLNRIRRRPMAVKRINGEMVKKTYVKSPLSVEIV